MKESEKEAGMLQNSQWAVGTHFAIKANKTFSARKEK